MALPRPALLAWALVFACLLGASGSAAASVLYRCSGAGGETAYVSNTTGYRACTRLGEWATRPVRAVQASQRVAEKDSPPAAQALPGHPPREAKADPAVLKVVPLGAEAPITVRKIEAPQAWRPLPVTIMDSLVSRLLPSLLGVAGTTPVTAPRPAPPATPAPERSSAIPLKLDAAAAKPPRTGAVYRVVQKNGSVLYTNLASLAQGHDSKMLFTYIIECYACGLHSHIDWNTVPLQLAAFGDDIRVAARTTGVDAALLRAIIHAESGFNPRALSYKGAQGLMQLMPGTATDLGVGDAFDPAQNISGGARYLAGLLHDFHGDVQLAAAAYNAGAGAVSKYRGVPPYAETEVYVKRVALLYARYRKALDTAPAPTLASALKAAG